MHFSSEGLPVNIAFELLALERLFDDPKLLKYKQLIILALRKDVQIQRLVHDIIIQQQNYLEAVKTGVSSNVLDALLQGLSIGEDHELTLLPYTAPKGFDVQHTIKQIGDRLRHNRYRAPQEFMDRIKTILHHASNTEISLPKDLLYSIHLFIMNHTIANDKEETRLKRQDTISEKFLQAIEYELRRRANQ